MSIFCAQLLTGEIVLCQQFSPDLIQEGNKQKEDVGEQIGI